MSAAAGSGHFAGPTAPGNAGRNPTTPRPPSVDTRREPADPPPALTAARQREGRSDGVRRLLASRGWLVSVLLLATALRVAYLVQLRATPWFDHLVVDPEYYDETFVRDHPEQRDAPGYLAELRAAAALR